MQVQKVVPFGGMIYYSSREYRAATAVLSGEEQNTREN